MSSRLHFGALQRDGYLEINLVENSKVEAFDSMMLLKNASKIKFAEEVIKAQSELKESEKNKDLKEIIASDLRSRSKNQFNSRTKTKLFDSLLSFLFSCFGYESTLKKIEIAFSLINRKEYEVIDQKEPKPESPKSPEKKQEEKVEDKKEDQPKSKEAEDQDLEKQAKEKAEQEAKEQAEKQAKEKADQEAKQQAEKQAKEKAEQEAKQQAEKQAKEKAEREAKEQAEKQAKEKAEQEAKEKAKLLIVNGGKKIPAVDDAERLEELQDYKESLRSLEEYKKDRANIDLKLSLQAAHRQEEIKKALNDELRKQVLDIYCSNLESIMNHLNTGNSEAAFQIVRALDTNLQDPFLEFIAERVSSNGNYFIARMFALSIKDEQKRMNCFAKFGLLNSLESMELSQQSDEGKNIAALIQNKKFDEALKKLNDITFVYWVLDSAIKDAIENGTPDQAISLINRVRQADLKLEYTKLLTARVDLIKIYNALNNQWIDHTLQCTNEILSAQELMKQGRFSEAVDIAIKLPTQVLSGLCYHFVEAYISRAQYVEARELVRIVAHLKEQKGLIFSMSPEAVYETAAHALILRGDIEEGIRTASLLSDDDKLKLVDNLIGPSSAFLSASPAALSILSSFTNQDNRWLKFIQAAFDESVCHKALPYIQGEVFKNFARMAIAAKFGNVKSFLECSNERLMSKSIEQFMNAFNERIPIIDKKEIEGLEAKVDALTDKELKRVLYGVIRSLYHRHPVDLSIGVRISKKIKEQA